MSIVDILVGKSFDRRVPGRPAKVEQIPYTVLLAAPDEGEINRTVAKYAREGWTQVARSESEGVFGIGAHTTLTFQLLQQNRPKKAGCKSCFLSMVTLGMVILGIAMALAG